MKSQMTCEQIYEVWQTEPELLCFLDIRDYNEYANAHIPGAIHIDEADLWRGLESKEGILNVVVATNVQAQKLEHKFQLDSDFVLLSQYGRWADLGYPLEGSTQINTKERRVMNEKIVVHQLFEPDSCTYTYLLEDPLSKEAVLIDPVLEMVDRDLKLLAELGLKLVFVLDTHVHADHITGANEIRTRFPIKTAISAGANVSCADILLKDGQELAFGSLSIKAMATPGHTDSCMSYYCEGMLFTGDTLLIRGCGRTDFQQGSSDKLYESVHEKLFLLPDDTRVYPGHDYRGHSFSTIGLEKKHNPRLGMNKTKAEFARIMSELNLANPKKMQEAVPANLACGKKIGERVLKPTNVDGIPIVQPHELAAQLGKVKIIDVRGPGEFNDELGHIPGAHLFTLGGALSHYLEKEDRQQELVFVCRSGGRSQRATEESIQLGYQKTANLAGGMLRWNEELLPVETH